MEMTGRPEDGLGWLLAREPFWTQQAHFLRGHICWHKALVHLGLGQDNAALAQHDGPMRAVQRPVAAALTNPSALLWRLDALGYDVSGRGDEMATLWLDHADGRHGVFF